MSTMHNRNLQQNCCRTIIPFSPLIGTGIPLGSLYAFLLKHIIYDLYLFALKWKPMSTFLAMHAYRTAEPLRDSSDATEDVTTQIRVTSWLENSFRLILKSKHPVGQQSPKSVAF